MPLRPLHPCSQPGCPAYIRDGGRCDDHKRERWQRQRCKKDPAKDKFYSSSAWRKLRAWFMNQHSICQGSLPGGRKCRSKGTECDHIQPIELRPDLALNQGNLQSLCKSCHSRKTAGEVLNG